MGTQRPITPPAPNISLLARLRFARRQAAHVAEAVVLVGIMSLFAAMPIDWASKLGGYLGRGIGSRLGVSRRASRSLRRAIPENGETENRRILASMWDNLGRSVAEYPHLARICAEESGRIEIINGASLTRLLETKEPAIFFGGHFANWEIGPSVVHNLLGDSLLSVYRAANNPWVDQLMRHRLRSRRAVAKGPDGGRELLRHLRQGGHLAMLVDQKMNDGIAVPFFGRDAMTAPAIARLALRFGCPVVPVRVERLGGARFRVTILPPVDIANTGNATADVLAGMARVNAIIEGWVRACPEQWLWLHRRWPDQELPTP